MKRIALSMASAIVLSGAAFAGGDIEPALVPVPVVVNEAGPFYIGVAYAATSNRGANVDLDFFSIESGQDRTDNATFIAGYDYNEYIGIEGRYTTSFSKEQTIEMDGWSIFAKPQYHISQDFKVYALLGFGGVNMSAVRHALPVDADGTSFQWGVGLSYSLKSMTDADVSIFLDYTSLANDIDATLWDGEFQADADALTVGITYNF